MSCFKCRFYTGENFLACGVDPITASSSPEEGCRDWQPNPNPWGFWELLINCPHVDDVEIGSVPIDGWNLLLCDLTLPAFWYEPYGCRVDEDGVPYVVVTRDEPELGYMRAIAVGLPDPGDNVYEEDFVDNEFDDD